MKKLLLIATYFISTICYCQHSLTLDLSLVDNSESINPQTITSLVLVNSLAIPGTKYSVYVSVMHIPLNKNPLNIGSSLSMVGGPSSMLGFSECSTFETAIHKLKIELDESEISKDIENLEKEIKNAPSACNPDLEEAKVAINETTKRDTLPISITVRKGDKLKIIVTRGTKKWIFEFVNEQPNHWSTYYGFTFIPDVFTKFSNYYSNQQTDGSYLYPLYQPHHFLLINAA